MQDTLGPVASHLSDPERPKDPGTASCEGREVYEVTVSGIALLHDISKLLTCRLHVYWL